MFIHLIYGDNCWFILHNEINYLSSINAKNLTLDHFKLINSNYVFKEKINKDIFLFASDKFISITVDTPEKMWEEFVNITTLMEII